MSRHKKRTIEAKVFRVGARLLKVWKMCTRMSVKHTQPQNRNHVAEETSLFNGSPVVSAPEIQRFAGFRGEQICITRGFLRTAIANRLKNSSKSSETISKNFG